MKRFQSIGVILSAITGILVVTLVAILVMSAGGVFEQRRQATRILSAVNIARNLLWAKESLRAETEALGAALGAPQVASRQTVERLVVLHSQSQAAIAAGIEEIKTRPPNPTAPGFAEMARNYAPYRALFPAAIAAAQRPREQRSPSAIADWRRAVDDLLTAINRDSIALTRGVVSADPFIGEMMRVNYIAWGMRVDARSDRGNVAAAIAAGRALSVDQLVQFAEMAGRIDAPWAAIEEEARRPFFPAKLKQAVASTKSFYFGRFRAARKDAIDALASGRPAPIPYAEWVKRSDPGLDSMTAISRTALDLTRLHAGEELAAANRNLYNAIALVILSIGLASFTMLFVMRRIIGPLRRITQTMRTLDAGDLEGEIPFEGRHDEIGEFAHALRKFRDGAIEKHQLESRLLHSQVAKQVAETSNRIKSEFLASMSQELRTPLNAIIGFSHIMQLKMFGPESERYDEYVSLINESGHRLLGLVSDLLDLAKIEAGKFTMDPQPVDLRKSIYYCIQLAKRHADGRGIKFAANLPDMPMSLVADPRACNKILLNLLSNAVKFSHQGGLVNIIAIIEGDHVRLTVRDAGIGIPAGLLSRIGQAFGQVCTDPLLACEGTGLGLALVRALVGQHGGALHIDSQEDVGTAVTVELPLSQQHRIAA